MTRTPKDEVATREFHLAIEKLNSQRPTPSHDRVRLWAYKELDLLVSDETIRRAFVGQLDPNSCQVEVLFILKAWFDADFDDFGPIAAQRMRSILRFADEDSEPGPEA